MSEVALLLHVGWYAAKQLCTADTTSVLSGDIVCTAQLQELTYQSL